MIESKQHEHNAVAICSKVSFLRDLTNYRNTRAKASKVTIELYWTTLTRDNTLLGKVNITLLTFNTIGAC